MKARLLVVALQCVVILTAAGFILGVMGSDSLSPWLRWTLALVLTASGVVLQASVCTHRHVTLQPAVRGAGPDRDHARWYCHRCGRSWNASVETNTKPRLTYGGHDETLAIRAAARADALERERRRLAVKRAGWASGQVRQSPPSSSEALAGPRRIEAVPSRGEVRRMRQ
jgi:hypothetical protein